MLLGFILLMYSFPAVDKQIKDSKNAGKIQ